MALWVRKVSRLLVPSFRAYAPTSPIEYSDAALGRHMNVDLATHTRGLSDSHGVVKRQLKFLLLRPVSLVLSLFDRARVHSVLLAMQLLHLIAIRLLHEGLNRV